MLISTLYAAYIVSPNWVHYYLISRAETYMGCTDERTDRLMGERASTALRMEKIIGDIHLTLLQS